MASLESSRSPTFPMPMPQPEFVPLGHSFEMAILIDLVRNLQKEIAILRYTVETRLSPPTGVAPTPVLPPPTRKTVQTVSEPQVQQPQRRQRRRSKKEQPRLTSGSATETATESTDVKPRHNKPRVFTRSRRTAQSEKEPESSATEDSSTTVVESEPAATRTRRRRPRQRRAKAPALLVPVKERLLTPDLPASNRERLTSDHTVPHGSIKRASHAIEIVDPQQKKVPATPTLSLDQPRAAAVVPVVNPVKDVQKQPARAPIPTVLSREFEDVTPDVSRDVKVNTKVTSWDDYGPISVGVVPKPPQKQPAPPKPKARKQKPPARPKATPADSSVSRQRSDSRSNTPRVRSKPRLFQTAAPTARAAKWHPWDAKPPPLKKRQPSPSSVTEKLLTDIKETGKQLGLSAAAADARAFMLTMDLDQ